MVGSVRFPQHVFLYAAIFLSIILVLSVLTSLVPETCTDNGYTAATQQSLLSSHGFRQPATSCIDSWTADVGSFSVLPNVSLSTMGKMKADSCKSRCIEVTSCLGVIVDSDETCWMTSSTPSSDVSQLTRNLPDSSYSANKAIPLCVDNTCVTFKLHRSCALTPSAPTARRVRIFCWVLTTQANHRTKAIHVRATWGRRCTNGILFVTEVDDLPALRPTFLVDVPVGRAHLTAKSVRTFDHIYRNHINEADWFLKADDDTYVFMDNLRHFLSEFNHNDPLYFGYHWPIEENPLSQGFASGGAGYVLSREALRRFGLRDSSVKCPSDGGGEDVAIGVCLEQLGVKLGDTTDSNGRNRFNYWEPPGSLYTLPNIAVSVSDYPISFHYVSPANMYSFDFYYYRLHRTA